jgi:hypothetical protein
MKKLIKKILRVSRQTNRSVDSIDNRIEMFVRDTHKLT